MLTTRQKLRLKIQLKHLERKVVNILEVTHAPKTRSFREWKKNIYLKLEDVQEAFFKIYKRVVGVKYSADDTYLEEWLESFYKSAHHLRY